MFGRPSHIEANFLDANQIVEPGQSDKAAFDPEVYHAEMRAWRSEGLVHYIVAFLAGMIVGFLGSYNVGVGLPQFVGLLCGIVFVLVLAFKRHRALAKNQADAVALHAQAHTLEMQANQLEIERAKQSGAFARWEKT